MATFLALFVVAFFLNLLYELLHSVLYTTCLEAKGKYYRYLMLKGALFDSMVIGIMYGVTHVLFGNSFWIPFIIASLIFAWFWEVYSLKKKKWEYAKSMPVILGVGLTPLVQLALTGFLSILIVKYFLV